MGWYTYFKLLEHYDGNLSKATKDEMKEAAPSPARIGGEMKECDFCKGKRKVQSIFWITEDENIKSPVMNCPKCGGSGERSQMAREKIAQELSKFNKHDWAIEDYRKQAGQNPSPYPRASK
jgi:hypothetical protein